mmetsp:Transcript_2913/g.7955  ORF Transcript_2913/g.7955 Transcript_2913/m.7955 type:complete len:204 (+) Transcript_2913:1421-2032(+)
MAFTMALESGARMDSNRCTVPSVDVMAKKQSAPSLELLLVSLEFSRRGLPRISTTSPRAAASGVLYHSLHWGFVVPGDGLASSRAGRLLLLLLLLSLLLLLLLFLLFPRGDAPIASILGIGTECISTDCDFPPTTVFHSSTGGFRVGLTVPANTPGRKEKVTVRPTQDSCSSILLSFSHSFVVDSARDKFSCCWLLRPVEVSL